jgi:hypothetical protein
LTVYTEKLGKIFVRAKGVGKRDSKLKGVIEPFNVYEFLLAKSKNIDVLANAYPEKEFVYLRGHLENLSLAIYFGELVDKLVIAPERDAKIWALLVRAMEVLDKTLNPPQPSLKGGSPHPLGGDGGDFEKVKLIFEEKLLEFLGHPTFKMKGKKTEREKNFYLNSLAGEEIRSVMFLNFLKV